MARRKKRLEKKRKAREDAWVSRARQLYSKGEYDAFLASVRRRGGEVPETLAEPYREIRRRVLRRALQGGDLAAVEAEMEHGPLGEDAEGDDAESGLGALAQALTSFLAGDDAAARRAVAGVEAGGDFETLRRGLAAVVGESNGDEPSGPARAVVGSFLRLREMHEAALSGKGTGRESLDDPRLDAVRQMLDALVTMRHRDHSPGSGSAAKPVAACVFMRSMSPRSVIVAAVEPRAAVLAAVIEADRRVRAGGAGAASRAISGLEAVADRLDVLTQPPPPVAVAVQFALERRLRRLLEAVAEAEGTDGLATLVAARPALAGALMLDGLPLETESPLLEAVRLRDPWDRMGPAEFARRVARLASAETDPLRLAQLMQVELDARVASLDGFRDEEEGSDDDAYRRAKDLLQRVGQMAGSLRRTPPPLAREIARLLRADLSELALLVEARHGWQGTAEQLLVHLPDDPFLLLFAVAGARAEGDVSAYQRLERRIAALPARKAPLRADEAELVEILLEGVSAETASTLDAVLEAAHRLVSATDWQRIRPVVAAAFSRSVLGELCGPDLGHGAFEPEVPFAEWMLDQLQNLVPHLGGEAEFDALRVALASVAVRATAHASLRLDGYLASHDDFDGAHAIYRAMHQATAAPGGEVASHFLPRLAARVVDLIEPGHMQNWIFSLSWLADDVDAEGREKLEAVVEREREAATDPELLALLEQMSAVLFEGASSLSFLNFLTKAPSERRGGSPFGESASSESPTREKAPSKKPSQSNDDQLKLF